MKTAVNNAGMCMISVNQAEQPSHMPLKMKEKMSDMKKNVLGGPLTPCSMDPVTGFYRDGSCFAGPDDPGCHAVCAEVTEEFLIFSAGVGNDLSKPNTEFGFPGLRPGDRWCVCAARWKEAYDAGVAPPVILKSTHEAALHYVRLEELLEHAAG